MINDNLHSASWSVTVPCGKLKVAIQMQNDAFRKMVSYVLNCYIIWYIAPANATESMSTFVITNKAGVVMVGRGGGYAASTSLVLFHHCMHVNSESALTMSCNNTLHQRTDDTDHSRQCLRIPPPPLQNGKLGKVKMQNCLQWYMAVMIYKPGKRQCVL